MRNLLRRYAAMMLALTLLAAVPAMEADASEKSKTSDTAESLLTGDIKKMLEGFELGEEEQEYLEEIKDRLAAGELDSEEEILDAISEAEDKFDFSLSKSQKDTIVSLGLKVQDMGLDSEELEGITDKLVEKYGNQLKEEAETIVQEKIVEPAKEAVKEGTKSAVKNFFGEMKRSIVGFWEKITN